MDDICSAFSKNLKSLMLENSVTANQLALETGLSKFSILHWLSGSKNLMPCVKNIVIIANYFDCSIDFLIGAKDTQSTSYNKTILPFSVQFSIIIRAKGLSLYQLSKIAGFSSTSVFYDWLHDKKQPNIDSLLKISNVLNITIDELVGRV